MTNPLQKFGLSGVAIVGMIATGFFFVLGSYLAKRALDKSHLKGSP